MGKDVNKAIIIGRLGQDPDVRYTTNGTACCNLSVATDESYKDKSTGQKVEKTEWHKVSMFGKLAEVAGQYLRKGSQIYIEGKLETRKWQNKEGQDQYTTEIKVDIGGTMKMLDSKPEGGGQKQEDYRGHPGSNQQNPTKQTASSGKMPEPITDFDDDK